MAFPRVQDPAAAAVQRQRRTAYDQAYGGANADYAAQQQANANSDSARARTAGREQELRADPVDAMIRQRLTGMVQQGGPFDAKWRSAAMTRQADMGAAAEGQRAQALQQRAASLGMSPTDAAVQAAAAENTAQRQSANQQAGLELDLRQGQGNWQAQQSALGQLAGFQGDRNAAITGQQDRLSQMELNRRISPQRGAPVSFEEWAQQVAEAEQQSQRANDDFIAQSNARGNRAMRWA
jgi:hypothetical protein